MTAVRLLPCTSLPFTLDSFTSGIQFAGVVSPQAGRLKRGWECQGGSSIVAPLIILPDSIRPSQASRTQTWNIHNSFIPHAQRSLQKILREKQLDCQGQFASSTNSILRSHRNCYLRIFIFNVHFQIKLVSLGPAWLRTLRTLQKARTIISSFWQGSATEVYPMQDRAEKHFI